MMPNAKCCGKLQLKRQTGKPGQPQSDVLEGRFEWERFCSARELYFHDHTNPITTQTDSFTVQTHVLTGNAVVCAATKGQSVHLRCDWIIQVAKKSFKESDEPSLALTPQTKAIQKKEKPHLFLSPKFFENATTPRWERGVRERMIESSARLQIWCALQMKSKVSLSVFIQRIKSEHAKFVSH